MQARALLVDFGGTLATERSSRAEIYARAAAERGIAVTAPRMAELMAAAHAELPREIGGAFRYSEAWFENFVEHVFGGGLGAGAEDVSAIAVDLLARFSDPATFRLQPGAEELLDGARAGGLALAVVSNWSERLPELLVGLGLADRVDAILASAIERVEKPDPEIFRRALGRLGVAASAAMHVGDRPDRDVAGARAAGIRAVLFDPDGTIDDRGGEVPVVRELAALLDRMTAPRR